MDRKPPGKIPIGLENLTKTGPSMARPRRADAAASPKTTNGQGAKLGFEADMFLAADKLRKNLEPSDYKHVALGRG
jgi:hypothetical protein